MMRKRLSIRVTLASFLLLAANEPIECFFSAERLGLTEGQRILLCTKATTQDPIRCFKGIVENLSIDQKVSLCQGASSTAPVECVDESFDLFLSFDQKVKLCNGAIFRSNANSNRPETITAPVHCFRRSLDFL